MKTIINSYPESKDKILSGLNKIAEPVISTLTPKGSNVLLPSGQHTNDGATIADYISSEDPQEQQIIQIVRQAAKKTNAMVGDGTTTTILLTQNFLKEGFKLIDAGWNRMALQSKLNAAAKVMMGGVETLAHKAEDKEDLFFVAKVSANGDEMIAKDVVDVVNVVGQDGLVVIEDSNKPDTEIKKETGFIIEQGMFSPQLSNTPGRFEAAYKEVKILVTDKRIYHAQEVMNILTPLAKAGIHDVVIIARDFIGQAPNAFLTNHTQGKMNILLVKDPTVTDKDISSLEDLAVYLGCPLVTDKAGKLTNDITLEDFGTADRVISNQGRTVIYGKGNVELQVRIAAIKDTIENESNEFIKEGLKKRLARMTQGMVTIKVGGRTPSELRERIFRYEDSVNATRAAQKDGYVVGGGVALHNLLLNSFEDLQKIDIDIAKLMDSVCLAPLRQIAANCELHFPELLLNVQRGKGYVGYNALTEKYEDLHEAGIIEPVGLLRASFQNALSVSLGILTSKYQLTDVPKEDKTE